MASPVPTPLPILFLDVDGVLNCLGSRYPRSRPEGGRGTPLYIPPGTKERVAKLTRSFEMVWATAWRNYAHRAWAKPLELKERWDYVPYSQFKLPALIRWAGERPWAWVDDDGRREIEKTGIEPSGLVVAPEPEVGLTDSHVRELLAFAGSQ